MPKTLAVSASSITVTAYNTYTLYKNMNAAKGDEGWLVKGRGKARANECIQCGACESVCPQQIEIRDNLVKAVELFEM